MKLLVRSRVIHVAVALLLMFAPMVAVIPPLTLYLVTGSVLMVVSLAAVCVYWPVVFYSLRARIHSVDKTEVLTFGIILLFAGTAFREAYITFWREFYPLSETRAEEFYYPLAFIRYTCIVAAIMALCARDMVFEMEHPYRIPGWPTAILSTLGGLAIGLAMTYLK